MKSNNNIYSFFIVLALLFWNPFSLYLIYGHTPVYAFKLIHGIYWFIFVSGICAIILIQKNKIKEGLKNILLTFSYTTIFFALLVILNNCFHTNEKSIIPNRYANPETGGLIFKPDGILKHTTIEFDYTAEINSLGLRNKEFLPAKGDKYRILCFGDSWTFGWGVNNNASWPVVLENYLKKAGIKNVEVINCGRSGQYTSDYKYNMQRIVPYLKPDLVLVGVLQLDDLAQLFENNAAFEKERKNKVNQVSAFQKVKFATTGYLKYSLSNFIALFSRTAKQTVVLDAKEMKASYQTFIKGLTYLQNIRLHSLNDSVKTLFENGQLNPGNLRYYIDLPDAISIFNNPQHPYTKTALNDLDKDLKEMHAICMQNNCRLVVINVPYNQFSGHKVNRTPNDFMNVYFENNNKIDSMYHASATKNNLPYIELTEHFRALPNKTAYFFLYDGHPTQKGYYEIGSYIGKELEEQNLITPDIKK